VHRMRRREKESRFRVNGPRSDLVAVLTRDEKEFAAWRYTEAAGHLSMYRVQGRMSKET